MFYLFIYCWEHLLSPVLANFDYTRWCFQLVITSDFQTYSLMVESLYPFATSMCSSWSLSLVQLCATLWTVAHQAPLSMGFFRQEYWSGLPFSSSRGIFLTQGSNLCLLCLLHYGQILYFLI